MEKRILLEKRGRSDDQITELILDNCRSTYIEGLTDSLTALETLSLINVGLVSLKNFPKLSNLRKLELSDNRISNGLTNLTGSPKLTHLNLSGNRIKDFDELQPLKHLQNLEVLDLFNNQVTLIENYRDKIFQLIPSLAYLDGFDKDFAEAPSDDDECVDDRNPHHHPSQFSINGIEIDLDELEQFESRVRQKRSQEAALLAAGGGNGTTDTDANLGQRELTEEEPMLASASVGGQQRAGDNDDLDQLYEEIQRKQAAENSLLDQQRQQLQQDERSTVSFLSLLLSFASLLALINQLYYRQEQPLLEEGILLEEANSMEDSEGPEEGGEDPQEHPIMNIESDNSLADQ
ncbi:acidic leucine-rich nuclear phosphoprotein 32 family member A isoform X1 [Anopheles coustani]|uniref:acidic leucine-rich nuclear phosphoprotein 32 family member A isoform X1 n=1 Tax=Anopheles coustani TaxID=139045 RepID=UPI00265A6BAB|nr:acidic leucine-rich nuclear phosphoprotein 32 family member A isoform X1 [Anopheles coustani]XP_058120415.1 acidic leucine-rich nuclear phosphoprotein 32 family member A isoform X1 [Anopheles coustani]XP_058120416.1 acidic leucine-rich nuclear phosphoprotein 32 family member A isoform X1 [Anopheles coustani]XP_058120417.1 acidic leucine-rich nuclear phosphoprotein 32 family member A isoform X1 [Anopheles coustani]XP_058120419.1 acidic leucine-rich nuclear phosphoprotein 32 family member A is